MDHRIREATTKMFEVVEAIWYSFEIGISPYGQNFKCIIIAVKHLLQNWLQLCTITNPNRFKGREKSASREGCERWTFRNIKELKTIIGCVVGMVMHYSLW